MWHEKMTLRNERLLSVRRNAASVLLRTPKGFVLAVKDAGEIRRSIVKAALRWLCFHTLLKYRNICLSTYTNFNDTHFSLCRTYCGGGLPQFFLKGLSQDLGVGLWQFSSRHHICVPGFFHWKTRMVHWWSSRHFRPLLLMPWCKAWLPRKSSVKLSLEWS